MRAWRRKLTACVLAVCCIALTACGVGDPSRLEPGGMGNGFAEDTSLQWGEGEVDDSGRGTEDQTWAVYWYLCGSDLESRYASATSDILEMTQVQLSDNVKVVIQTGGAAQWQNNMVKSDTIQRYLYDSEGLFLVDEQPQANMGEMETLSEFLTFCNDYYPADRTMVLFWNHGGGSVSGAAFDENYRFDSLTLGEFYQAFNEVYELDSEQPPVDVVGFDTCLMATIDTAYTFCDVANYLVASEEMEPGNGWYYTGWLQELADDPAMSGAQLGKAICDTYVQGCKMVDTESEITLSVTDLTKIGPLLTAYDEMGQQALVTALEDPMFFSAFGRQAVRSESYGGNTADQGYSNMVDLGHLARNCEYLLPDVTGEVLEGLDECVVYEVNGPYRAQATGLSCYYSYNGDRNDLSGYTDQGYSDAFKYFYHYGIDGTLDREGMEYIAGLGCEEEQLPEVPTLEREVGDELFPLYVNEDGYAVLDVGSELAGMLRSVYFQLAYVDEQLDMVLLLGRDNDIDSDWVNGVFLDNFRGVWGTIDGHLVYMELTYEGEDYNLYNVPILLNGEPYNLHVVYDYWSEEYFILGARKGLEQNGMADKQLTRLRVGDRIAPLMNVASISGTSDWQWGSMPEFRVTKDTEFYEVDLGDGEFMLMFELVDARNMTAMSQPVWFTVKGDDIYTSLG